MTIFYVRYGQCIFLKELLYTDPYVRYVLVLQTKYNFELFFINMKMHFCQVENLVKFQAKSISCSIVLYDG